MEFNERDLTDTPSRGYPVYKLLRAVNRQYPNNGFINYVDVREDMYDSMEGQLIDEDLRDLINETLQETYINIAQDEVYSFPTVPGQREYSLPENCDLRDIQEVTRTFGNFRCPPPPPPPGEGFIAFIIFDNNGGEGYMETIKAEKGDTITIPECTFTPPEGKKFLHWEDEQKNEYEPGDDFVVEGNTTLKAMWEDKDPEPVWVHIITLRNLIEEGEAVFVNVTEDGVATSHQLLFGETYDLYTGATETLGDNYEAVTVTQGAFNVMVLDMEQVYTENTLIDILYTEEDPNADPVVEPEPEHTGGDGENGGQGDNPLDDLENNPIDDGNGEYEDNPLGGD